MRIRVAFLSGRQMDGRVVHEADENSLRGCFSGEVYHAALGWYVLLEDETGRRFVANLNQAETITEGPE